MNQPLNELFMAGCGVFGGWTVHLSRPEHRDEERTFHTPYALVGSRPENCLHLPSSHISRRHAYLQALPGGIFCVDLNSRAGVRFGDEQAPAGWLRPDCPVHFGPYTLDLLPNPHAGWLAPPEWAQENPLVDRAGDTAPLVPVVGEVREAGTVRARWRMNRMLALVGRSPHCQVYIGDRSLSRFHCSLVRTPMGLWVIDLLSREGTYLNGMPVRCERLREGDELQLGKYVLRFWFLAKNPTGRHVGDIGEINASATAAMPPAAGGESKLIPAPAAGPSPSAPLKGPSAASAGATSGRTMVAGLSDRLGPDGAVMLAMVNQFNRMQQEMFDQFQERLLMATRLFATLHQEQMNILREGLERLSDIADELRTLQEDMARRGAAVSSSPEHKAAALARPSAANPLAENKPATPSGPPEEDVHTWLNQRISALQEEQESRWQKLLGMILGG
jgi:pSer/pThr/pTyr-binding forkhead associated (FHA) protein